MFTFIILGILIIIGIGLAIYSWDYDNLGFFIVVICGIYLLFHTVAFSIKGYEYELFLEKRNAFEETLKDSRENGSELEAATIVREVSDWNILLSKYKYKNKTLFFDQYIDDRIETLNPIK